MRYRVVLLNASGKHSTRHIISNALFVALVLVQISIALWRAECELQLPFITSVSPPLSGKESWSVYIFRQGPSVAVSLPSLYLFSSVSQTFRGLSLYSPSPHMEFERPHSCRLYLFDDFLTSPLGQCQ